MLSRPQTTALAFLAFSSFAHASWFDEALDEIIKRQQDASTVPTITDTLIPPVVTPSTTTSPSITIDPPTTTNQPTTTPSPSSTTTSITTSTESSTTTSSSTSTTTSTTTEPASSSSTTIESSSSTTSTQPPTTAPVITPSPTVIQVIRTETINGQVRTTVSESTSTIQPTSTTPAELNQSNETSGSGMSPKTRGTIIGVVVGLGGAVLLGGLAVVAYRIWGRKKSREEGDDFMNYSRPDTGIEKAGGSSGSGSSNPFKSTLENYHNPAKVNASSNF